MFDYIYFPLLGSKAEAAAERYLEEKYEEEFVIDTSSFSKPLGNDMGTYKIDSHPTKNPKLTVRISIDEEMRPISDNYLDMKWRALILITLMKNSKEKSQKRTKVLITQTFQINISKAETMFLTFHMILDMKKINRSWKI
ncbi:hypothetical protein [Ureibacillus sp. GCM10028918]|uniref:hypothetical protein n=1 Tax=Ureibacillus sp. GCM10028918 TaxID=3273429 RepID=UPI0036F3D38E